MTKPRITAERARELLKYDPETGNLFWCVRLGSRAAAGARAGTLDKVGGYLNIRLDKVLYRAHRVIWLIVTGEWPFQIDHIDRDRLNNRWRNLRQIDDALNRQNVEKVRSDSAVGIKGVHVDARRPGQFGAVITVGGKRVWLGTYDDPQKAHLAYLDAKAQIHPAWEPSEEALRLLRKTENHLVTASGNRRVRSDSRTGVVGVFPCNGRWGARHKRKHIGVFDTIAAAAEAVEKARLASA